MVDSITYGLASARNENILTLSNFNLDFSIVKFVPPPEYHGLGLSLSPRRRQEAEDGTTHTVARKLALLLCHDLPDIPNLIKAYGKRASEIAENPSVNPQGSALDGVFQEHVGLDATSLWASATSGKNTVALHLLACMLSRIWKSKAVSVWAEIVERRRAILRARIDGDVIRGDDITASAVQISRDQLAEWDSSARSWLESADTAFSRKQKQLMLILDNCNIGIPPSGDTLSAVINAWTIALQFMESVVSGQPMAVRSGEVLLAMSSWHLYPDLEVLGHKTTSVKQKDPLVAPGGIVTIGLENPNVESQFGISWSLPLSHLRYYGKSVLSTGSVNYSGSRVPMGHLVTVALGSAIGSWAQTSEDVDLFADMLQILKTGLEDQDVTIPKWLLMLHSASKAFLESSGECRHESERLFQFGRRRATTFLSDQRSGETRSVPPWLGLKDLWLVFHALKSPEAQVNFLRELYKRKWAKELGDMSSLRFAIILHEVSQKVAPTTPYGIDMDHGITSHLLHPDSQSSGLRSWEFASLAPIYVGADGAPSHRRWISGHMPERYGPNCYVPIATSAALRFKELSSLVHESITIVSELYPQPSVLMHLEDGFETGWLHTETQPSKKPIRGWDLESHPDSAIISKSPGSHPHTYRQHSPKFLRQNHSGRFYGLSNFLRPAGWTADAKSALSNEVHRIEAALQKAKADHPELLDVVLSTPTSMNSPSFFETSLQSAFHQHQSQMGSVISGATNPRCRAECAWDCYEPAEPIPESSTDCLSSWYVPASLSKPKNQGSYSIISKFSEVTMQGQNPALVLNQQLARTINARLISAQSPREALECLTHPELNFRELLAFILRNRCEWMSSLDALWDASELYRSLPGALVELSTSKTPLCRYQWCSKRKGSPDENSLAWELACIATFETGYLNIDPKTLIDVMGVSTGSSLYMSRFLTSDPGPTLPPGMGPALGRCVGNIGKPGLAFLISVSSPEMKEPGYDRWNFVQHAQFEGDLEDNFPGTSLHLSFTGYKQPLLTGEHGLRDTEIYFLQSAVQVYDKGSWIADINILRAFSHDLNNVDTKIGALTRLTRLPGPGCPHSGDGVNDSSSLGTIKSIDCWDEIIDEPDGISIARAKGNRLARLALSVVAFQKKKQVVIADESICWDCVRAVGLRPDAVIIC